MNISRNNLKITFDWLIIFGVILLLASAPIQRYFAQQYSFHKYDYAKLYIIVPLGFKPINPITSTRFPCNTEARRHGSERSGLPAYVVLSFADNRDEVL